MTSHHLAPLAPAPATGVRDSDGRTDGNGTAGASQPAKSRQLGPNAADPPFPAPFTQWVLALARSYGVLLQQQ
jgi:hypothetical protein